MRIWLKTSGRRDTQDYTWVSIGTDSLAQDINLLRVAEQNTPVVGRVMSLVVGETGMVALYLGNATSGRKDFYGTPISNRLGLVFHVSNSESLRAAKNVALDWMIGDSLIVTRLFYDVIAADATDVGFVWKKDLADNILAIGNRDSIIQKKSEGVGCGLGCKIDNVFSLIATESVHGESKVVSSDEPFHITSTDKINTIPNKNQQQCTSARSGDKEGGCEMNVYFYAVGGDKDHSWWKNLRPKEWKRLKRLCDPYEAATEDALFYAALDRQDDRWCLFLQNSLGTRDAIGRLARVLCAIEIYDSADSNTEEKARRILADWLMPDSDVRAALANHIDISGDCMRVDEDAILSAIGNVAVSSRMKLGAEPMPTSRRVLRLSPHLENQEELRREAQNFVLRYSFPRAVGVWFLFSNTSWSDKIGGADGIPDIEARFIVAGHRLDVNCAGGTPTTKIEDRPNSTEAETTIRSANGANSTLDKPPPSIFGGLSIRTWVGLGIMLLLSLLLLVIFVWPKNGSEGHAKESASEHETVKTVK